MTFRKLNLFPSSGEWGEKTPTQLGPLERANLSRSQKHRTIEKVKEPSNFMCYTPSSEPCKIYLFPTQVQSFI
jgi:hypothetical protein